MMRLAPIHAALLVLTACGGASETLAVSEWCIEDGRPRPRPSSDLLGDVWGEENGVERKRWLREMHRAASGDDWRAIERANARLELARRTDLVRRDLDDAPGTWEEVGSRNQAGHTRCAALGAAGPGGRRHLYVGSANGGLWRGDLEGRDWTPISDQLFGGVDGVLALPPAAPGGADRLLLRRGAALFHSRDGGRLWSAPQGLGAAAAVRRMLTLPVTPAEVLLLAQDEAGRALLYASEDGGARFELRWRGPAATDLDLWVARGGQSAGREVWLALGGSLRRSLDGGRSFDAPRELASDVDGVRLAGSEAGGPRLFLAVRQGGAWSLQRGAPEQGFERVAELEDFWGPMIAFCGDPEVLLVGGLEAHRSTDGGRTFQRVNAWGQYYGDPAHRLHADLRGMTSLPDPARPGQDLCLISTDGGTYLSADRGASVHNLCLDGLGVAQLYSTLTARDDPDLILAGTQDQGYQRGRRRAARPHGPSTPFDQLLSGDYGYLVSSGGGHDLVYSSYPGFVLVQEGAQDPDLLYPWIDLPAGAVHAWMPPVVADPRDAQRFYLLADRLYRYRRSSGARWAYRAHSAEDFTAGGGRFLTALAFAPTDPARVHAANDVGLAWTSQDGGLTWRVARVRGNDHLRPTCIAAHPDDADRAVMGGAGYSGPAVLETRDGGRSWSPSSAGLPRTLVYDLAWAGDGSEDLYAATEAGAWRLRAGADAWQNVMGRSAPATTYWSVEAVQAAGLMRFGTYGRGIWDFRPAPPQAR